MLKVIDYAKLSKDIYKSENLQRKDFIEEDHIGDQKINGWKILRYVTNRSSASAFFGQLYALIKQGEVIDTVFAIRGTVPTHISNDIDDLYTWWNNIFGDGVSTNKIPHFALVHRDYMNARRYCREHFPHIKSLKLTGHSLGGALAKCIVALKGMHYTAVAFNAPGIANIPGVNHNYKGHIHNIDARYGLLNKVGSKMGYVRYIDVPNDEKEAKALFNHFDTNENNKGKLGVIIGKELEDKLPTFGIIEKLKGTSERLYTYAKSAIEAHCDQLMGTVSKDSVGKIIYAQHNIDHIIYALHNQKNLKIAHQFIH